MRETPPTAEELDAEMEAYWKTQQKAAATESSAAQEEEGLDLGDEAELGDDLEDEE